MGTDPNLPVGAAIPAMGDVQPNSSLDMLLDDLFPNPEVPSNAATTQPAGTPQAQPAVSTAPSAQPTTAPQPVTTTTTPSEDFFFRTSTGTVYKTREDALRGTEQKDRLIEKLRQDYIREKGIDPITGKPASISVVTNQPQQATQQSYAQSDQFFDDLYRAVEKGDKSAYRTTLGKFVSEIAEYRMQQILQPLQPLVSEFSRTSATSQVQREIANFAQFAQTPEYQQVLTEFPDLKLAIDAAEQNPSYAAKLPEYYKLAYRAAYGKTVPDMVRSATPQAPTAQAPIVPAVRPTTQGANHPVSAATTAGTALGEQSMQTPEGRKAIIAAWEAKYGRDSKI